MTKFIGSKKNYFKNRQPLLDEDFVRLTLAGGSGAFRERLRDEGGDYGDLTIGCVVQSNCRGDIKGSKLVKCGTISSVTINTTEIWGETDNKGKITIDEHDVSIYPDLTGLMTSQWTQEVPWRVKIQVEGKWKSVKSGALKDHGFSDLCFRMNVQPTADSHVKISIGCVPYTMGELTSKGDTGSRYFPTIKVSECRGKLYPMEEEHHKFGIAVQPLMIIDDVDTDENGYIDLGNVIWPKSQDVKEDMTKLFQSATMPNYHLTFAKWKESVAKGNYERRDSALKWPSPRREDEDTEESGLEDTDGKHDM